MEDEDGDNEPPFTTQCRISGYLRKFVETGMLFCTLLIAKLAIELLVAETNPYTDKSFLFASLMNI